MKITYTVCNRDQLPHALCLGESLFAHNPDRKFVLGWVDPAPLPALPEWVQLVRVESVRIPGWETMVSNYYSYELVAACRPFFGQHLLREYPACTELIFLSPTTFVLQSLDSVIEPGAFMQLTPHQVRPRMDSEVLDDKGILNIGMYTSGGWIMQPDGQQDRLFDWWCARTQSRGYFNLCEGMCMDQLWLNYVPIYFDKIKTIRSESWRIGLYNFLGLEISAKKYSYYVQTEKLLSVDFAGLEGYDPIWSNYEELSKKNPVWKDLRKKYREKVGAFQLESKDGNSPYGKPIEIKSYRSSRKKGINFLKRLIAQIENFNLTYN